MGNNLIFKNYKLVIVFLNILFALQFSPLFDVISYDNEVFQYIGMIISKGYAPYVDAFDHKPPIIYFVNLLGFKISNGTIWGIYGLFLALNILTSILIFKDSIKFTNNKFFSVLITGIYIDLINNTGFFNHYNLTRQLTTLLFVLFLHLYFNFKRNYAFFFLGLIVSIVFFTQQNEVIVFLPFLIFILSDKVKLRDFKPLVYLIIGFSSVFITMFILLSILGCYEDFIYQNFKFNFNNYLFDLPLYKKFYHMFIKLMQVLIGIKYLPIYILSLSYVVLKNKSYINLVFLAAFVLQFYSSSASGRSYGHYLLMFIPLIIYSGLLNFNSVKLPKFFKIIFISIFIFQVTTSFVNSRCFKLPETDLNEVKAYKSIREIVAKSCEDIDNSFYSFEAEYLRINYSLKIKSPSKYIYCHFHDTSINKKIVDDIIQHKPMFLLISKSRYYNEPVFNSCINSRYHLIQKNNIDLKSNQELFLFRIN